MSTGVLGRSEVAGAAADAARGRFAGLSCVGIGWVFTNRLIPLSRRCRFINPSSLQASASLRLAAANAAPASFEPWAKSTCTCNQSSLLPAMHVRAFSFHILRQFVCEIAPCLAF